MDFLEIRRKAKERAAAEAGQAPAAPAQPTPAPSAAELQGLPPPTSPTPPAATPPAATAPAATAPAPAPRREERRDDDDREEEAEAGGPVDARFTTWRPGSGERPFADLPESGAEPRSDPRELAPVERAVEPARAASPVTAPLSPSSGWEPLPEPSPRRATSYSPVPARDPLDEFFYRSDEELPTLASLPVGEEPEPEQAEDAGVEEYLTFLLGAEEFAVAIERVREVLKSQAITEVPRAPAGILGVVTVRGDVVAVFDPRRRLGLPGPTPEAGLGRIVIVDDGEGPCGLLVDTVASVVRLARGSIEPTPQGIGGAAADCLAGIGREDGRLFTVLDLAAVLRRGAAAPRGRGAHAGA